MIDETAQAFPIEQNTETYLLTNKGLEKLDIKKDIGIPDENEKDQTRKTVKIDQGSSIASSKPLFDAREMSRMKGKNSVVQSNQNIPAN